MSSFIDGISNDIVLESIYYVYYLLSEIIQAW